MANLSSIARPYALAAFECARDTKQLSEWKAFLEDAAMISRDATVAMLLKNPEFSSTKIFDLYQGVLSSQLNPARKNFLMLLAQNKRFDALPEIFEAYNTYYAALEKSSNVRLVTAITAEKTFKDKLSSAISKRLQRDVALNCEVDPAIIGGAIIHIGDRVIDGSVRGKLNRLLETLTG